MAAIEPGKIRNVAVVGHRGTGKTSLVEALLYQTDEINRLGAIDAGTTVGDWDEDAPDPESSLEATEMREALGEAIARLPEREKLVVTLYYYEELTLREIGEVIGVTESRVSQLHTKAVLRLKARLSGGVRETAET